MARHGLNPLLKAFYSRLLAAASRRWLLYRRRSQTSRHPQCHDQGQKTMAVRLKKNTVAEVDMTSPTAPDVTHFWTNPRVDTDEVSAARIYAGFQSSPSAY